MRGGGAGRLQRQNGDPSQSGGRRREVFTPAAAEIAESEEIVQAFKDNPQAGVIAIRGHMVDRAHVARAERLLARAKAARP